ncbi:GntR family trehalose operon transcriptional repressor [Scopulibacillus darangshiensis]|uniref:Trehalose operon repressor n=1 Tax=Scopulibacillus darangshiensis TaxID=442528 RepID=A0A4V2SLV0_9BACL|nr:GntR family trehalose operon transcriptional repressor [Scopulibacillus darangshiensis]
MAIYNEIAKKIRDGKPSPGQLLPSEHDLTEEYNTSRETIRKALNLLSQNGYIQKMRGRGSIVLDVSKFDFPVSGLVSFKELADNFGLKWGTHVHELVLLKPDEWLKKELQMTGKEEVWKLVRSREIDGERIILDKDFIKKEFVPTLTKDISEKSIYEYFENDLGLVISFAKKEITVEEVTEEDQTCLDLMGYKHVVVVKNHVYLEDASLLQMTESRHRLDKFRFVDFARREHRA